MSRSFFSLRRSFCCAFRGIAHGVRRERNLRIHLTAAVGVLLLSVFYDFSAVQWAVIFLLFALVISAELMNTAVERVVDLLSPGYNKQAGLAKDIAAGAVFITAVAAALVGILFFLSPAGLQNMWDFMQAKPLVFWLCILAYVFLGLSFVFGCKDK